MLGLWEAFEWLDELTYPAMDRHWYELASEAGFEMGLGYCCCVIEID